MGVFNQGFSGETTTLQDYTGAAWESFAGTAVIGSNPTTTLTYYLYTGTGFYPQVSATVSGLTGSRISYSISYPVGRVLIILLL